jgi:Tol biopolymer transport system component/DNA-binding winged helix-turn-helix (wHTH) protein
MQQSSGGAGLIVQFEGFELDHSAGQLTRDGQRVKIQNLPYKLLVVLLERPGEVVTYEELRTRLWGETVVDFEEGLHTAVRKLRTVLGDSATHPRFIETVPRRGYCFVAPIRTLADEPPKTEPRAAAVPVAAAAARPRWHVWAAGAGVAVALAAASSMLLRRDEAGRTSSGDVRPITSYRGVQRSPALSPDGAQVAFSWVGESGQNLDIYIQRIDSSEKVRLTDDPAPDEQPAWSPDGRTIAFFRKGELHVIPAIGGPSRRIAAATGQGISWSPDSRAVAVSDRVKAEGPIAIFLVTVESGERRQLTFPPSDGQDDQWPAFSPDGRSVAFTRRSTPAVDVYRVPVSGGEPVRVAIAGRPCSGLVWTPDDKYLLFATGRHAPGLLIIPAGGRDENEFRRVEVAGLNVHGPSIIARNGGRDIDLAYGSETTDWDIAGMPIGSGAAAEPKPLVASARADQAPSFSPDGKFLAFASSRTGYEEIWVSNADGSGPRRLTNFNAGVANAPRWSPDGKWIVFGATIDKNPDIHIVGVDGGPPQRLTRDPSAETQPSWSRDGRWVYFMSNRSGEKQIWRIPTGGGQASQVTKQGGFQAIESWDGKWVYYAKRQSGRGLWRVPSGGGPETLVSDYVWHNLWALSEDAVFYFDVTDDMPQVFAIERPIRVMRVNLDGTGAAPVATINASFPTGVPTLEVTRDGKYMAWVSWREHRSELMLIRNLRLD